MSDEKNKNNKKLASFTHHVAPGTSMEEMEAQIKALIRAKHGEDVNVTILGSPNSDKVNTADLPDDMPEEMKKMIAEMTSEIEDEDDDCEEEKQEKKECLKKYGIL